MKIVISRNGPVCTYGSIPLYRESIEYDRGGTPVRWVRGEQYPVQETYALCRCGKTGSQPFCDGTHARIGFDGDETASRKPYSEDADLIEGPGISMSDLPSLCSLAKFCHRGHDVWQLAATASDPESVTLAISNACDCPSGRLVALDRMTGTPIEPDLEPSISLVEMPADRLSGPIWVKGGIPIESADGTRYEVRNRVTLCRCGSSDNKPFCDGAHHAIGFNDRGETVRR